MPPVSPKKLRNGRGAMVWELGEDFACHHTRFVLKADYQERYPGDPQGRARMAGVQEEFVAS